MERQDIQMLRELPIEGVAERMGMEVTRHKALCPFHNDHHASLSFNMRKNTFRCFVCGEHGGTIDLVMRCLHKDFKEACSWLGGGGLHTPSPLRGTPPNLGGEFGHTPSPRWGTPPNLGGEFGHTPSPLRGTPPNLGGEFGHTPSPRWGTPPNLGGEPDSTTAPASSSPKLGEGDRLRWRSVSTGYRPNSSPKLGELAQRAGGVCPTFDASRYARFFDHPYLSPEARHFLFEERRLDPRVVRWCRLTSWRDRQGVNWLQIPYYDSEGRLVGIQNRNLDWFKEFKVQGVQEFQGSSPLNPLNISNPLNQPRFKFPRGSECGIYNLPILNRLREGEELWIAEGASDCWAMLSAGHKAIAIPSATLLKRKDLDQLLSFSSSLSLSFHMAPDRDEPGERLFLQLRQALPNLTHHQLPPGCKDYGEYHARRSRSGLPNP